MAYPDPHFTPTEPQVVLGKLIHRALRIPGVLDAALTARCPDQAARLGAKLAHDGLKRLPDAALERRAAILLHLLQEPEHAICGALLRGGAAGHPARGRTEVSHQYVSHQHVSHQHPSHPDLGALLTRLPRHLLDSWIELSLAAMAAELRADPAHTVGADLLAAVLQRVFGHLPQRECMRLFNVLRAPQNQPDSALCLAARTVYTQVLAAPPADRAQLLRALLPADTPLVVGMRRNRAPRPREMSSA